MGMVDFGFSGLSFYGHLLWTATLHPEALGPACAKIPSKLLEIPSARRQLYRPDQHAALAQAFAARVQNSMAPQESRSVSIGDRMRTLDPQVAYIKRVELHKTTWDEFYKFMNAVLDGGYSLNDIPDFLVRAEPILNELLELMRDLSVAASVQIENRDIHYLYQSKELAVVYKFLSLALRTANIYKYSLSACHEQLDRLYAITKLFRQSSITVPQMDLFEEQLQSACALISAR